MRIDHQDLQLECMLAGCCASTGSACRWAAGVELRASADEPPALCRQLSRSRELCSCAAALCEQQALAGKQEPDERQPRTHQVEEVLGGVLPDAQVAHTARGSACRGAHALLHLAKACSMGPASDRLAQTWFSEARQLTAECAQSM